MLYLPKPHSCHLQWHITEKCNFHCTHCYLNEDYIKDELTTEECYKVVDDFADFCKKTDIRAHRNLTLSGGEPILKKDWWKILDYISNFRARNLIDRIYVMTNGSTVTEKIAQRYIDLGVGHMQISLEGMSSTNDKVRGKGNYLKAIKGAEVLIGKGIPLSFSLTLTKENMDDIEPLAFQAAKIGVSGMGVGRLVPVGMGEQMRNTVLSPKETRDWYYKSEQINQKLKNAGHNFRVDFHCSDGMYQTVRPGAMNNQTRHACSTPYDVFTLLPNGDVVPCRRLPIVVGNVRQENFLEIHYSSNKIWNLKNWENRADECKTCDSKMSCKGGGMCIAYGYFGTPYAPDPDCWKIYGDDLPNKKYERDPDSDKITYFSYYINNLRTDLAPVNKDEWIKNRYKIKVSELNKTIEQDGVVMFDLKEEDLNPSTGAKIKEFLDNAKDDGVNLEVGQSLPPCIFDVQTAQNFGHKVPNQCSICPSLFKLENNKRIVFCNERKGPDLKFMNSKEQIWEYHQLLKTYDRPKMHKKCESCTYRIRGNCYYMSNCTLEPIKKKKENPLKLFAADATMVGC